MSRPLVRQAGVVFVALVAAVVGCGKAADGFSGQRGKVSGKATLAGEPLPAGCQVLFIAKLFDARRAFLHELAIASRKRFVNQQNVVGDRGSNREL